MNELDEFSFNLSLISHTSSGKTTLGRTLLMEDIGEVSPTAHTTLDIHEYPLIRDRENCQLVLWDTPGFGNSIRLLKRAQGRDNPIGWLRSQLYDRFANRNEWLTQNSLVHMKEKSDVILYLVDASDEPEHMEYLDAEVQFLEWANKPVIVILNQMGAPKPQAQEQAIVDRWKDFFKNEKLVTTVIPLDAFSRCWVQERALFEAVRELIPESRRPIFDRLIQNWNIKRVRDYQQSLAAMAALLKRRLLDQVKAEPKSIKDNMVHLANQLGLMKGHSVTIDEAQSSLRCRAADDICQLTNQLIELNHLKGEGTQATILKRLKGECDVHFGSGFNPIAAGAMGAGLGSAASAGLFIDLASGGLTLGLGTLVGGLIGALGGAKAADYYNEMTKDKNKPGAEIAWSQEALNGFLAETMLLYLAVSHFGRGRGEWEESEYPPHWQQLIHTVIQSQPVDWNELREAPVDTLDKRLEAVLDTRLRYVFKSLYNREP